jgi:hypothetical protein
VFSDEAGGSECTVALDRPEVDHWADLGGDGLEPEHFRAEYE